MIVPVKENSSPAKFKQNKLYDFHIVLCILLLTLFMCLDKLLVPSLAQLNKINLISDYNHFFLEYEQGRGRELFQNMVSSSKFSQDFLVFLILNLVVFKERKYIMILLCDVRYDKKLNSIMVIKMCVLTWKIRIGSTKMQQG